VKHILRGLVAFAAIVAFGVAVAHIPSDNWQIAVIVAAVIGTAILMIARDGKRDAS
jgi:membrane protein implicated in regulation of membrane protease activity